MVGKTTARRCWMLELFAHFDNISGEGDVHKAREQAKMGTKRKAEKGSDANAIPVRPKKRVKPAQQRDEKPKLLFSPQPDWHAAELPPLPVGQVRSLPPQHTVDELHKYANTLLDAENAAYNASQLTGSSSHKFLATIMSSGTLEDKVSALTLLVQESPLHTKKALENLVGLAKKRSRNQALMAVAALKDLLGQGVVLPNRKLRAFGKQPALMSMLQGKAGRWTTGEPLPAGLESKHLVSWAYEDWLKRVYFELLQALESWCNDEVEYARSRAVTYVWELLKDKPEQEENLLRLLVNKLGDTERKIASRASYLLLQLEVTHPAMKPTVTDSIEADCIFRPGQSLHAKYYAIITLNQTILSQKEESLANRLLDIYFSLFVQLLKPIDQQTASAKPQTNGKLQGGGGKAGKLAAKKRKAEERSDEAEVQLRDRMIAQVLTGINRAFPFADTNDPTFEKQMDTIFRVAHSGNFNTSIQALMLLQQISSTKHYGAERFYRTLYESLFDPRLIASSKQVMYLNLLYKSLKADLNAKRVQAFIKRLLQVCTMHEPPFVCGVLYLISELETTFPSIRSMMKVPEVDADDEEERFVDVPEAGSNGPQTSRVNGFDERKSQQRYDARKRDPEHARAEHSCLWDLLPYVRHFHPSVSLFADCLLLGKPMPPKPDPTQHTLMHFLDRFVYRNAKSKQTTSHGSSVMQPMAGSSAADMLIKPGEGATRTAMPVNSENFWRKKVEDVAADEVFFHAYFNQAGGKKRTAAKEQKHGAEDDEESDEDGEEEIWQAIAQSKPEVEGADEDDDLSMGDLESDYSGDEDGSEPGIDLGGGDDDGEAQGDEGVVLDDGSEADEELPELDSGDEALLGDDDDVLVDVGDEDEGEVTHEKPWKAKRKEKKKLRQLPTFASADDYAKLLDNEPDDI